MKLSRNLEQLKFNILAVLRFIDYIKASNYVTWKQLFRVLWERDVSFFSYKESDEVTECNLTVTRKNFQYSKAIQTEQGMRTKDAYYHRSYSTCVVNTIYEKL